jgi:hypothetical protein
LNCLKYQSSDPLPTISDGLYKHKQLSPNRDSPVPFATTISYISTVLLTLRRHESIDTLPETGTHADHDLAKAHRASHPLNPSPPSDEHVTDAEADAVEKQEKRERGERVAENMRYGKAIPEQGVGGFTTERAGEANQSELEVWCAGLKMADVCQLQEGLGGRGGRVGRMRLGKGGEEGAGLLGEFWGWEVSLEGRDCRVRKGEVGGFLAGEGIEGSYI